jgi:glycerol-3-phosphate dehydrogenase (NAD(P)+)
VKVAVLGAGSWGTALAMVLAENGNAVTVWGRDAQTLEQIRASRRNERYLPGVELPGELQYDSNLDGAISDSGCVVMAIPSKAFRGVAEKLANTKGTLVSVTKGIEYETGKTMCGVLRDCAPGAHVAALSGPTFAIEVARGLPTAIVAASDDETTSRTVQELFHRPKFRVYRSNDLLGVELGGALKNVIAIAAGVCDGLRLGDNAKASLLTRGIAEIRRLGVAAGAQPETFAGLSGLGDLTLTCFSRQSRNRDLGERAGRGESVDTLLAAGTKLAEGYPTARSAHFLAKRLGIPTPITDEVYAILYEGKSARQALGDLLNRESKAED